MKQRLRRRKRQSGICEVRPPFRCIVYAFLMAWYNGSMRDWDGGESFSAGRNDLYMSSLSLR